MAERAGSVGDREKREGSDKLIYGGVQTRDATASERVDAPSSL